MIVLSMQQIISREAALEELSTNRVRGRSGRIVRVIGSPCAMMKEKKLSLSGKAEKGGGRGRQVLEKTTPKKESLATVL